MTIYTPRHEEKTGSDLSGISGAASRTITLANANSIGAGLIIVVANAALQQNTDFTKNGSVITFVNAVWDAQAITFDYLTPESSTTSSGTQYTDTLTVVRVGGLGNEVFNENLGTGDASEKSFDLDNGNAIDGSYTLKYGATDSNNFTDLVDTDDYVLSLDDGTVYLTDAGVTKLSTNILYADYTYSDDFSDTVLATFVDRATDEVDYLTGSYWGTTTSFTEFFDGYYFPYPSTDEPFIKDYDAPYEVQLKKKNIISVNGVYTIQRGTGVAKSFRYSSSAASYTDVTTEMNSLEGTAFQPFADTTAANDYLYIGCAYRFYGMSIILFTEGVTTGTNTIEYYDGSSWTAFTATESEDDVLNFESTGSLSWSSLSGWSKTTVNSSSSLYWLRIKANSTYSTEAKINVIAPNQDFVVSESVPLYNINWSANGRLAFENYTPTNGVRNVRVDYNSGLSTVPDQIKELTALLSTIRSLLHLSGGSYNDISTYSLGRKSFSIGQVYVNIESSLKRMDLRVQNILDQVGRKLDVF